MSNGMGRPLRLSLQRDLDADEGAIHAARIGDLRIGDLSTNLASLRRDEDGHSGHRRSAAALRHCMTTPRRNGQVRAIAAAVAASLWLVPALVLNDASPAYGKPSAARAGSGQAPAASSGKAPVDRPSAQPADSARGPAATAATAAATPTAASSPQALDADTQAELRECQTRIVPGSAVSADTHSRPELVVGRRRVFDRVRGYMCIPSYAISPKPVTQGQYEAVIGVRPHGADYAANRPVFVSFVQAAQYCNTVSLKERLTPCYEMRIDKQGKKTVAWPNRQGCSGYRLPAIEEAAAYERGTESEWTWVSSTLPLGMLDARNDAPRGFYLARNAAPAIASQPTEKRHAKR